VKNSDKTAKVKKLKHETKKLKLSNMYIAKPLQTEQKFLNTFSYTCMSSLSRYK